MILKSEIISTNLDRLESAKAQFPILIEYQNIEELKNGATLDLNLSEKSKQLREECKRYDLSVYIDFIDFILFSKRYKQEVFYKHKIQSKELQEILVENAQDDDAKSSFKSKSVKSMQVFMNSEKWNLYTANVPNKHRKRRRYVNNLIKSDAIIANYIIQNEIDIELSNIHRINRFYTNLIPKPDVSIKNEINKTKEIIDSIVNKISELESDFRKINCEQLVNAISEELKKRMLAIDPGDKIKCIEVNDETKGLTLNKTYDVISKSIENGILKVVVKNDKDFNFKYNYRVFETITNLRNSALDNLLNEL